MSIIGRIVPFLVAGSNVNNIILVGYNTYQGTPIGYVTVAKPSGTAVGDILIIAGASSTAGAWGLPTGFTDLFASSSYQSACYKVIAGGEPASFNYSNGLSSQGMLAMTFRNCTMGVISTGSTATGTSIDAPSITATAVGTLVSMFGGNNGYVPTTPSGMTVVSSLGSAASLGGFTQSISSGDTGTRTSTVSASSNLGAGQLQLLST